MLSLVGATDRESYAGGTAVRHKLPVKTVARMAAMARGHARMSSPALCPATAIISPCRKRAQGGTKPMVVVSSSAASFLLQLRRASSRNDPRIDDIPSVIATILVFARKQVEAHAEVGVLKTFIRLLT